MKIHDISVSISSTMPTYPGDPPVLIEPEKQIARGDLANVSRLSLGDHTGTHVDPPIHFIPGGKTVDQLDLNVLCGPAAVVDMTHVEKAITARDLARVTLTEPIVRILFKTRNSALWERTGFQEDYVGLAGDAAQWLVDHQFQLVGIDYLSVELFHAPEPHVHRTLLGSNVIIVEGLNLKAITPGIYTFTCLPLKIEHGDGALARAILTEVDARSE